MRRKHQVKKNEAKDLMLQNQILEMRTKGLTFVQIGLQLNISQSHAHTLYTTAIDRYRDETRETAEQITQLELIRLDALTKVIYPMATDEELLSYRAQDQMLKIHDRRVALLNLKDANVGEQDSEVTKIDLNEASEDTLKDAFSDLYR